MFWFINEFSLSELPRWLNGKESFRQAGDKGWSLDWKIPWRRKWQPTLVFLSGNLMGRGAWQAAVHRISELDLTSKLSRSSSRSSLSASSSCSQGRLAEVRGESFVPDVLTPPQTLMKHHPWLNTCFFFSLPGICPGRNRMLRCGNVDCPRWMLPSCPSSPVLNIRCPTTKNNSACQNIPSLGQS